MVVLIQQVQVKHRNSPSSDVCSPLVSLGLRSGGDIYNRAVRLLRLSHARGIFTGTDGYRSTVSVGYVSANTATVVDNADSSASSIAYISAAANTGTIACIAYSAARCATNISDATNTSTIAAYIADNAASGIACVSGAANTGSIDTYISDSTTRSI